MSYRPSASNGQSSLLGLLLCGSVALGGFLTGARPAMAEPAKPAAQQQKAPTGESQNAASMYEIEATQNEKQGHWLGAVAAWRGYARTSLEDGAWKKAMTRLHDACGLSWATTVKAHEVLPLVVGKDVVAVPYRIKYSDGLRNAVTAIDPVSGKALWTREDAVVFPYNGDLVVFVQNWEHVVAVDVKTGSDLWAYPFPAPDGDRVAGTRNQPGDDLRGEGPRRVLGLHGDTVLVQCDTWPVSLELASGKVRWGPSSAARHGYRARLTPVGVVTWPGQTKPHGMADAEWQASPMVMLSYDDGKVLWKRRMIAGEPWYVVAGTQRLYVSDPNLQTEIAWTAVSLEKGATVWRQPQAEARPSVLTQTDKVLVVASPEGLEHHLTRFLDPASGKVLWQSEHVIKVTQQGFVLVLMPGESLQARDIATGNVLWTLALTDGPDIDPYGTLVDGAIYLNGQAPGPLSGASTPAAVSASTKTGQVAWSYSAADVPYPQDLHLLATAGDEVLLQQIMRIPRARLSDRAPNDVSSLLALDATKGNVQWGFYDLRPVSTAPPVRVRDTVYVVAQDKDGHAVYAFDLARIRDLVKQGRRWWW